VQLKQHFFWYYLYPMAHLLLYAAILRRLKAFSQERTIFLYHGLSAVALAVWLLGPWMHPAFFEKLTITVGILSFHGIYSLSFLELWWLSDGGYSLRILDRIGHIGMHGFSPDLSDLQELGASKKKDRLQSLRQFGLIRTENERFGLSQFGRIFTFFLFVIQWPSQILKAGQDVA